MTLSGSLMALPLRTKSKDQYWANSYGDIFDQSIAPNNDASRYTTMASTSDPSHGLFETYDTPIQHLRSSSSELQLLTEPHPALLSGRYHGNGLTSPFDTIAPIRPLIPQQSASIFTPETHGYGSPEERPSSADVASSSRASPSYEDRRGRSRIAAQQRSTNRARHPSGIRKSLRHTKSTPTMSRMPVAKMWVDSPAQRRALTPPPVPALDEKWLGQQLSTQQSPPDALERSWAFDSTQFVPLQDPVSMTNAPLHYGIEEFAVPDPTMSPLFEPLDTDEAIFRQPFDQRNFLDYGQGFLYDNAYLSDHATIGQAHTLPHNDRWQRTDAPYSLGLNTAALNIGQASQPLSAPAALPYSIGLGLDSLNLDPVNSFPFSGNNIYAAEESISPRTTAYPAMPNFSLPYRILPPQQRRSLRLNTTQAPSAYTTATTIEQVSERERGRHHRRSKSEGPSNGLRTARDTRSQTPAKGATTSSTRSKRDISRTRQGKQQQKQQAQGCVSGFVNLTPHDSEKLLTGVAPSGSTKTKAKRDREELEKRRRLSAAAIRAVMEGDLGRLREVGINVDER